MCRRDDPAGWNNQQFDSEYVVGILVLDKWTERSIHSLETDHLNHLLEFQLPTL